MTTYISKSTVKPIEWDITSSPTTAYHNYNVKEIEAKNDLENGIGRIEYEYTTDKMTQQEYNVYVTNKINILETQTADIAEAFVNLQYEKETEKLGGNI